MLCAHCCRATRLGGDIARQQQLDAFHTGHGIGYTFCSRQWSYGTLLLQFSQNKKGTAVRSSCVASRWVGKHHTLSCREHALEDTTTRRHDERLSKCVRRYTIIGLSRAHKKGCSNQKLAAEMTTLGDLNLDTSTHLGKLLRQLPLASPPPLLPRRLCPIWYVCMYM